MSLLKDQVEIEIQEAELATQKALLEFPPLIRWVTILVAVAIIPAYFIAKNSAHSIWQKRLSQGQLLAKLSFINPLPPKISKVFLTTLGTKAFAAAILVTNQNLDLSVEDAPFTFIFTNSEKQTVYTYSGKLFLLPNESKYVVVPTFSVDDKITYADFRFLNELNWQKKLQIPKIIIYTSQPSTYQQTNPSAFVVEGSFTNSSPYQLKQINLTFILTNLTGTIIGVSSRNEYTVAPFEKRSYKQLWPNMNNTDIAGIKVFAQTDVLDPGNIVLPDYKPGEASDLSRPTPAR